MTAKELLKLLKQDGWYKVAQKGSHLHLKHPKKKGKITVSIHAGDVPIGTLHDTLKNAELKK